MPPVKAKNSPRTRRKSEKVSRSSAPETSSPVLARELLHQMIDYEAAARERGIDFTASRYRQLTASERDFVRAELIADYIRLSAGNTGRTPGYYDAELISFCSKICDMEVPSQELVGTYLAAINIVATDKRLTKAEWLADAVRRTMPSVLHGCADLMKKKTEKAVQALAES